MNATEHAALLQGIQLHDELTAVVDERTLEILDRRRRTAVVRRRGWLVRRMLLVGDIVGLTLAILVAEWIGAWRENGGTLDKHAEMLAFFVTLPAWVFVAKLYGLYDGDEERADHSTVDDFAGVFHMVTICTWLFTVGSYLTGVVRPTASKLIFFWALAILMITLSRAGARSLARKNPLYLQNAVIVGAGVVGQLVGRKILQHPEYGINLVGFVDAHPRERSDDLEHLALLGGTDRLLAIVRLFDVERVIFAFSGESHEATIEVIQDLKGLDVQIDIVPRLYETVGPNVGVHMLEGLPLVGLPPLRLSMSSRVVKRCLDVSISGVALLLGAPLLLALAIAVKATSRGPILYRHERIGRGGKEIDVLKFRTMRREACRGSRYGGEDAEAMFEALLADSDRAREFSESYKFARDPRTTRVGRFLRSSSLDELPQLVNVLRGDLSLVGPRAITADELPRYGARVDELLGIRPGVTGMWQVNGRSRLAYDDRVRLDLSYIANWSVGLDLEILAKTLKVLLARRGAV